MNQITYNSSYNNLVGQKVNYTNLQEHLVIYRMYLNCKRNFNFPKVLWYFGTFWKEILLYLLCLMQGCVMFKAVLLSLS